MSSWEVYESVTRKGGVVNLHLTLTERVMVSRTCTGLLVATGYSLMLQWATTASSLYLVDPASVSSFGSSTDFAKWTWHHLCSFHRPLEGTAPCFLLCFLSFEGTAPSLLFVLDVQQRRHPGILEHSCPLKASLVSASLVASAVGTHPKHSLAVEALRLAFTNLWHRPIYVPQ